MNRKSIPKTLILVGVLIAFIIGIIFIYTDWRNIKNRETIQAIKHAEAVATFLDPELVKALAGSSAGASLPVYNELKQDLIRLKNQNTEIKFAYLLMMRDDKLYFLVDSEPPESAGYSQPGQEYYEATEQDKQPFAGGQSLMTTPVTDRWGTWVSALVPIKDETTGEVIAIFGIDYPADSWNAEINSHVFLTAIMVVCIMLLLGVIYRLYSNVLATRVLSSKLEESESLIRTMFDRIPVGIALVHGKDNIAMINQEYQRILGVSKDESASVKWADITHPDDLEKDVVQFNRFLSGAIPGYSMEKRYIRPDGTHKWVQMIITGLDVNGTELINKDHLCIILDIHDRKIAEETLRESERSKAVLLSHIPGIAYRCLYDEKWTMLYLSAGCYALTGYHPEEILNNSKLAFDDIISEEYRDVLKDEWKRVVELHTVFKYEYEIETADGSKKWVIEMGQPVFNERGDVEALEGIIIDMTESRRATEKILYMADHDDLTDLYNRKYFEEAKLRLEKQGVVPSAVILADINGMRLINDAFGQAEGDMLIKKTVELIKGCCDENCIIARTGGDEFSILMPNGSAEDAERLVKQIKDQCDYRNAVSQQGILLNLSTGYGIRQSPDQTIASVLKEAEEFLNRHKILERKSHHNTVLSSIMATMYARSFETEEHAERLTKLSGLIGVKMDLNQKSLMDLELLSILHDIGKIGIDDRILNKPGPLADEEWAAMKKHPEIGFRIAMSAHEFEGVAEFILCHHERWDGKGYPQGLAGEEIPLLSRIIAVADAYDAMTEDRVYRKGMSREKALEEIQVNAGRQFDPIVAELFISIASEQTF